MEHHDVPGTTTPRRGIPWLIATAVAPLLLPWCSALVPAASADAAAEGRQPARPTIVFVHGAFADSSSWNEVVSRLAADGYPAIAVANPLRGVKSDAAYVSSVLGTVKGPVVLVGHSYGGMVITQAAAGAKNVKSLVYVAGFAPAAGESAVKLSGRFPGSTLGPALTPPVRIPGGGADLYIRQSRFWKQFAADLPEGQARLMAVAQRPVTEAALGEPATGAPAWKTIPSWFVYGERDKNIPPAVHAFMAKRAGAKETVEVKGASHVVMLSRPAAVAKTIEDAAGAK
ncbi:alpha/beta hydrolase [Nonomuraea sp. NPDC005501]|uniref:alpha/beta fold hydrolase n=1 Tax=Nonomuraea sp. NPDC005501 TaxID=3156884 RepID=UPI0033A16A90